ncbi:unnamed protein product, partial [Eruca vesicaria subsp. sativa]|nr:unnamed protein product [Eruca vesicaria subsp. sativa]
MARIGDENTKGQSTNGPAVGAQMSDKRQNLKPTEQSLSCSAAVLKSQFWREGILKFVFSDARSDCSSDYAAKVADLVKQEGHEFDSFVLEVSVPSTIMESEQSVQSCKALFAFMFGFWFISVLGLRKLYLKGKYNGECWVQSEKISVKDALNLVLDPLKASF